MKTKVRNFTIKIAIKTVSVESLVTAVKCNKIQSSARIVFSFNSYITQRVLYISKIFEINEN